MATNFGYIRKDQDARVNWQEVGKNASDTIQAEIDRRETIKADIDADSNALDTQIYKDIDSDNADLASEMLSVANLTSETRLRQDTNLKNGSLSLKDYTIQRNNLKQGVANISEMNKSKIKIDKDFQTLVQAGTINPQSVAVRAYNEQFENLNNFGIQLDEFGSPYLAKRIKIKDEETGVINETFSTDPNDIYSIKGARANMGQILKQQDFTENVKNYVGLAGKTWVEAGGQFKTVDDAWQNENFRKLIEAEIRADLTNPDFASGFAGQYLQGYEYAFLKGDSKANANQIPLVQINGRWTFDADSKQGKKLVDESVTKLTEMTRGGMSKKETPYSPSELKGYGEIGDEKDNIETTAKLIGDIYNGDVQELKSALVYFEGKESKITNLEVSDDGSKFSYDVNTENGGKVTRTLDRNFGPENFLTQMSKQIGTYDLAQLRGTKAYESWSERNNGEYTNLPNNINFRGAYTEAAAEVENLLTRDVIGEDGNTIESALKSFNKAYDKDTPLGDKVSIISKEFLASNIENAKVEQGSDGYLYIEIDGTTTGPIVIKSSQGGKPVSKIISDIQQARQNGKKYTPEMSGVTKEEFFAALKDKNMFDLAYSKNSTWNAEDAWNGGKGKPETDENSGVNGSMFNQ